MRSWGRARLTIAAVAFVSCGSPDAPGELVYCETDADCPLAFDCYAEGPYADEPVCMETCNPFSGPSRAGGAPCLCIDRDDEEEPRVCYLGGPTPLGIACEQTRDCMSGAVCLDGTCTQRCEDRYRSGERDPWPSCPDGEVCLEIISGFEHDLPLGNTWEFCAPPPDPGAVGEPCRTDYDCLEAHGCYAEHHYADDPRCMKTCGYFDGDLCSSPLGEGLVCVPREGSMSGGEPSHAVCYLGGPAALGERCTSLPDCEAGTFCFEGRCRAPCGPAGGCPAGRTCETRRGCTMSRGYLPDEGLCLPLELSGVGEPCDGNCDCQRGTKCFREEPYADAPVCLTTCPTSQYPELAPGHCPDYSICLPAPPAGSSNVCYPGGTTPVGEPCTRTTDCVAGAICLSVCRQACLPDPEPGEDPGPPCPEGEECHEHPSAGGSVEVHTGYCAPS